MAITDKEEGVWGLDQVYNKINEGDIWSYAGFDSHSLYAWGRGHYGNIANNLGGVAANRSSPAQIPGSWSVLVDGSQGHFMLGIKNDNTLWSWGGGDNGELGISNNNRRSSPVQIPGNTWDQVTGGERIVNARKTDGTMWTWGQGSEGKTGHNNQTSLSSPKQIPGTDWAHVSCFQTGMHAIKTNGTLWTWGENGYGAGGTQLPSRSSPIQVGTDNTWSKITGAWFGTFAVKTDGTLWAWGENEYGQTGNNKISGGPGGVSSPMQIPGTWDTTDFGRTGGRSSGYIIDSNGNLFAMGNNGDGQLGHNNKVNHSSPTQVPGSWKAVRGCHDSVAAIKTDGTLWAWGNNQWGEIGNGPSGNSSRSSPMQIGTDTNWGIIGNSTETFMAGRTA